MKILSLDLSLNKCGFSVADYDSLNNKAELLYVGDISSIYIKHSKKRGKVLFFEEVNITDMLNNKNENFTKINILFKSISAIIDDFERLTNQKDEIIILVEQFVFFAKGNSFVSIAGSYHAVLSLLKNNYPYQIIEVNNTPVKQDLTGKGNAKKELLNKIVSEKLKKYLYKNQNLKYFYNSVIKPDIKFITIADAVSEDVLDSLAILIYYLNKKGVILNDFNL